MSQSCGAAIHSEARILFINFFAPRILPPTWLSSPQGLLVPEPQAISKDLLSIIYLSLVASSIPQCPQWPGPHCASTAVLGPQGGGHGSLGGGRNRREDQGARVVTIIGRDRMSVVPHAWATTSGNALVGAASTECRFRNFGIKKIKNIFCRRNFVVRS